MKGNNVDVRNGEKQTTKNASQNSMDERKGITGVGMGGVIVTPTKPISKQVKERS